MPVGIGSTLLRADARASVCSARARVPVLEGGRRDSEVANSRNRRVLMGFDSLQDVFAEQLNDLRSAEGQLVEALPKLAGAASSEELRKAFEEHLAETRGHLERIDDLLSNLVVARTGEVCLRIKGL